MAEEKRRTGIDIIGDMPWGTHFCQFYKTKEDLLSILVPYFKAGLENNEFCMWITADPLNTKDAITGLKKEVKDLDAYIQKGQIEILDYTEWYTKTGEFDADRVMQGWIEKEKMAIKNGFDGLRLTGNTFWLERKDWKKFADYEMAINDAIHNYKMLAVCTYSLDKCDASDIIDVVSSHEFALIKKGNKWERIESYELKLKKEAIHLNEVLHTVSLINQLVLDVEDQKVFLSKACNALLQTRGYCMAWIGLTEEGSKRVVSAASAGKHTDYLDDIVITWDESPTGCGPTGMAIKTRQPRICRDMATDPAFLPWRNEALKRGFASSAVVPMMYGGRVFGALSVYAEVPDYFSEEEVALLVELGNDIALAMHNLGLEKSHRAAEMALRESEEKFRTLADSVPQLVWSTLPDGRNTYFNQRWVDYTGLTIEESYGHGWNTPFHPDDKQHAWDAWQRATQYGDVYSIESRLRRADGVYRWWLIRGIPLRDASGNILKWFGTCTDIEDLKRAEEALKKSDFEREQFFKFFQISPDIMVIADPNGCFKKVNSACLKTLGYTEEELLKKPFIDFIHPEDQQPTLDEMAQQIRTGSSLNFENRYLCKDGTIKWLSWRASFDKDRGITYATARDITEFKKVDSELHAASLYARNLIEASLDPLVTISSEGKIADVNKATEQVTGVPREQLIGKDFVNYFTEPEKAREGYKQVFSQGIVKDYPLTIRHASGYTTDVLYNASIYRNEAGDVQGVFAAARDVTERKRAEEKEMQAMIELVRAEKMDEMKNLFIASMSHELRTPLNSIIGFTGILLMGLTGELNDEQRKQLGMIKNSSHHLLELINDVIDVSKIEANMIHFANEEFNVEGLISEAMEGVSGAAKEKGLEMIIVVPPTLTMKGDRRRVKQIIINLLSNAVKFTDHGKVTVTVTHENDMIKVNVTDTGIGIKNEDMDKLFKQFSRIITGGRAIQEGSGLGLYLSQKIAGMLGGKITAQSEFEKGSVFTLELPVGN